MSNARQSCLMVSRAVLTAHSGNPWLYNIAVMLKSYFLLYCCKFNILLSIGATYCVSIKFIFWLSIDCIALRLWGGIRASDPPLCLVPPHLRFDPNATGKVCVGDFYHRGVHMSIVPDR